MRGVHTGVTLRRAGEPALFLTFWEVWVSGVFAREQSPAEVVAAISAPPVPLEWQQLDAADRTLGIAKLRLAGVYDDRQAGYFMLRTRIPGGRLDADQLCTVASAVRDFSHRPAGETGPEQFAEITTRQDLQVHWVRFEHLPEIWRRYEAVGLSSERACGDTLRNVTSCPVDGIDVDALLDARPVVEALNDLVAKQPRLTAFLPRKFKVVVTGCGSDCVYAPLNDLAFVPARGPATPGETTLGETTTTGVTPGEDAANTQGTTHAQDAEHSHDATATRDTAHAHDTVVGFNVYAGGGLSDSPRLASPLDLFVLPEQVPEVVQAALELFDERGDREHKAVNRFRILVHRLGAQAVRDELAGRLPFPLQPAGVEASTGRAEDHLGVHPDRFGTNYVGLCVPLGRLSADELDEVARLAREQGDGGIRLTHRQNLILTGIADPRRLLAEPLLARLRPAPDPFERAIVACTSAPFCKFAIVNAKEYAAELIEYLRARVPESSWSALAGLRLHVSGCKASCALVQAAHIGLRGGMAKTEEEHVEAFDIATGGELAAGRLGRWAAIEVPVPRAFESIAYALTVAAEAGQGAAGAARTLAAVVTGEGGR